MADAVAEVKEQRERPADQDEQAEPGADEMLEACEAARTIGGCEQLTDEDHGAGAERDPGDTIGDREDRCELRPVHLQMR